MLELQSLFYKSDRFTTHLFGPPIIFNSSVSSPNHGIECSSIPCCYFHRKCSDKLHLSFDYFKSLQLSHHPKSTVLNCLHFFRISFLKWMFSSDSLLSKNCYFVAKTLERMFPRLQRSHLLRLIYPSYLHNIFFYTPSTGAFTTNLFSGDIPLNWT